MAQILSFDGCGVILVTLVFFLLFTDKPIHGHPMIKPSVGSSDV